MADPLNLSDITNMEQLMARTPSGRDVMRMLDRLGLSIPYEPVERRPFTRNIADLHHRQLSDLQSYWGAEHGRIVQVIGLLQGQDRMLSATAKSARVTERNRLRRDAEAQTPPVKKTAGQLADEAEEAIAVRDADEACAMVDVMLAAAQALKESIATYLTVISREISFRSTQLETRNYG